jgi:hypothetical protein
MPHPIFSRQKKTADLVLVGGFGGSVEFVFTSRAHPHHRPAGPLGPLAICDVFHARHDDGSIPMVDSGVNGYVSR